MSARASVIVRCRDKAGTLERALTSLRRQTAEVEIVVVDSGSQDGSLEIAQRLCDRLVEIPPESFTFGYALNVGARAASTPFHFALSAHCYAERDDWIERGLRHYERPDVAGLIGYRELPDATPLTEPFYQDAAHQHANPFWGFSNHASSWRGNVWERYPFNEHLGAAEDREWAFRVLDDGWLIVVDPLLHVDFSHVWRSGLREHFVRQRGSARAIASFAEVPPHRMRDGLKEWWAGMPDRRHSRWLHRLDYRRMVGLAGKYAGLRQAAR
jgi:glycosyltransferase involved in cell wall biosynthesis